MRKEPKCKNCGGKHYTYQCWKRPKKTPKKVLQSVKKKTVIKKTGPNRQALIVKLDKLVSQYIRQKGADKQGYNTCYTCGARYHWKDLDCGHYIKRRYFHTRWDLNNVRPQCRNCNRLLNGNYTVYHKKIVQELGEDNVQKLWDKAYKTDKIPSVTLELMAKRLQDKVDNLKRY